MLRNKKDVKRLESELNNIGNQISSYSEESFDNDIKNLWQKTENPRWKRAAEDDTHRYDFDFGKGDAD